jgi:hypothetical protein
MPGGHPASAVGPAALWGTDAGHPWPRPKAAPSPTDVSGHPAGTGFGQVSCPTAIALIRRKLLFQTAIALR